MALFKCKMCGGELEVQQGMTICECPYCGTKQTLPNLDDEKRLSLYDRANHFRRNNEYDKAMDIYEKILEQDKEDAEAYWSIVLCRYGIEYVEDPTTHKRIPTVNRAQYTSVFIDEDYLSAIKYADGYQRDIYENEAKAIDEIQKNILSISAKEEPFDIFICYKETDSTGRRTEDSVYAQNIYKELTNEGYKVFFSRITLEDKLGTEYEPYIFAALNSAKVMIVVGTSAENLNSPWVQNEWSRYLNLIKSGEDKVLIPVYKNMSPYDLPEEFSYLQAQDMGKVGFMQDLVYGVKKIISQDTIDERQKKGTSSVIVETMTKRGGEALANSNWDTAIRCYDSILDYDTNNLEALEGKLKAIKQVTDLENSKSTLDKEECYKKILQIADVETKEKFEKINDAIKHKLKVKSKKRFVIIVIFIVLISLAVTVSLTYQSHIKPFISYKTAESMLENGKYDEAKAKFVALGKYKDSNSKAMECENEKNYTQAINYLKTKDYTNSLSYFKKCGDYKDSTEEAKSILDNYEIDMIKAAKVGDKVYFGSYEQDNDNSNGKENIEWNVLAKENNKALVISNKILDCRQFNTSYGNVTWENCTLRKWMNDEFLNAAFNKQQQKQIQITNVSALNEPSIPGDYKYNPCNMTKDKIFLLSNSEIKKYFNSEEELICSATNYAVANYAYGDEDRDIDLSLWWLRDVVYRFGNNYYYNYDCAGTINTMYGIDNGFHSVKRRTCIGVRPAMWIKFQ